MLFWISKYCRKDIVVKIQSYVYQTKLIDQISWLMRWENSTIRWSMLLKCPHMCLTELTLYNGIFSIPKNVFLANQMSTCAWCSTVYNGIFSILYLLSHNSHLIRGFFMQHFYIFSVYQHREHCVSEKQINDRRFYCFNSNLFLLLLLWRTELSFYLHKCYRHLYYHTSWWRVLVMNQ